jgi:hypothetical protein
MKINQKAKPFSIMSTNAKMDTSGMAGKPKPMEVYAWTPPPMSIDDMLEVQENKTSKKPEMED